MVGYKASLLNIFTPKWLLIRPCGDFFVRSYNQPPVRFKKYFKLSDEEGTLADCLYDFTEEGEGCVSIRQGQVKFIFEKRS